MADLRRDADPLRPVKEKPQERSRGFNIRGGTGERSRLSFIGLQGRPPFFKRRNYPKNCYQSLRSSII